MAKTWGREYINHSELLLYCYQNMNSIFNLYYGSCVIRPEMYFQQFSYSRQKSFNIQVLLPLKLKHHMTDSLNLYNFELAENTI